MTSHRVSPSSRIGTRFQESPFPPQKYVLPRIPPSITHAYPSPLRAQGLNRTWLATPDTSLPAPDLILYLSLPTSTASTRASYGEERYESLALQQRVQEEFVAVRQRVEAFAGRSGRWVDVDADGTVEQVAERIRGVVDALKGEGLGEVKRLWV